jgi:hypothetical protein
LSRSNTKKKIINREKEITDNLIVFQKQKNLIEEKVYNQAINSSQKDFSLDIKRNSLPLNCLKNQIPE